jgi:hypothetical protein
LKTKNLQGFTFLTIRRIRTKTLVEARIEHAESRHAFSVPLPGHPDLACGRLRIHFSGQQFSIGKPCGVYRDSTDALGGAASIRAVRLAIESARQSGWARRSSSSHP